MDAVWSFLTDFLSNAVSWVTALLPDSPFQAISTTPIAPYLPMINWFLPFDFVVTTLGLWLTAIAVYYAYSIILRWVKAVE